MAGGKLFKWRRHINDVVYASILGSGFGWWSIIG